MTKRKHIFIGILGVILLPFLISIYILDRIICIPLLHLQLVNIQTWYRNSNEVGYSIIRILITIVVVGFICLIRYLV